MSLEGLAMCLARQHFHYLATLRFWRLIANIWQPAFRNCLIQHHTVNPPLALLSVVAKKAKRTA
jgi:hypothetical protein